MEKNTRELSKKAVFIKIDKCVKVTEKKLRISDVSKVYCEEEGLEKRIRNLEVCTISENRKRYVLSALKLVKLIKQSVPEADITLVGEPDVVIEYCSNKKPKDLFKVIFICLICFIGGGFAIMAYNNDVSSNDLFNRIYEIVIGAAPRFNILEISYSVGLFLGIVVFYGHIGRYRFIKDPTPLETQMRGYETELNDAIIAAAGREQEEIDVD